MRLRKMVIRLEYASLVRVREIRTYEIRLIDRKMSKCVGLILDKQVPFIESEYSFNSIHLIISYTFGNNCLITTEKLIILLEYHWE